MSAWTKSSSVAGEGAAAGEDVEGREAERIGSLLEDVAGGGLKQRAGSARGGGVLEVGRAVEAGWVAARSKAEPSCELLGAAAAGVD